MIPGFGGGVVKSASAEAMQTNELQQADGADIGDREQLISAAVAAAYTNLKDAGGVNNLAPLFGLWAGLWAQDVQCLLVGKGKDGGAVDRYIVFRFQPDGEPNPVNFASAHVLGAPAAVNVLNGAIATFASFPYVLNAFQIRPVVICIAARSPEDPRHGCELLVLQFIGAGVYSLRLASYFDSLGTGAGGEFVAGTKSKKLYPRGVCAYNNHIFCWGFENSETTSGDSPARLMFSNLGNPLKWGNDDILAPGVDRDFSDTDAINIGEGGEQITGCLAANGKLWIGTNRGLHYLSGYGRDTFKTDGTTGIAKALDVVGPNGLCEGPDGDLYGCSTRGLWKYDGQVQHIGGRLIDPKKHSNGYWDLIWSDVTRGDGWPGRTNADLVWMMTDREHWQVWVVIPFCNATTGAGYGTDTVVIKYSVLTGGFTRQVFVGVAFTAGMRIPRTSLTPETILLANAPSAGGGTSMYRYRYRSTPTAIPASAPMTLTFGEYAPFGPNGRGVNRVCYFTVEWEDGAALPIVAALNMYIDQGLVDTMTLTIGGAVPPAAPADGDVWLDVTGTDFSIGNLSAGVLIPATSDYILFRWKASWGKWVRVPRAQGMKGTRATIPIAYNAAPGTRVKITAAFTSAGRVTIESLGIGPQLLRTAQ